VYVGLEIDLLAPGDGVVTDRHHASADNYEADDPMNQIEGQISPFTLSGWLRHGCEAVLQDLNATACHPGEPNAEFRRANVYDRDLDSGYHEKGACTDAHEDGCTVYDLFGGFGDNPGNCSAAQSRSPRSGETWMCWLARRKLTTGNCPRKSDLETMRTVGSHSARPTEMSSGTWRGRGNSRFGR
jgi:hypothetical protein